MQIDPATFRRICPNYPFFRIEDSRDDNGDDGCDDSDDSSCCSGDDSSEDDSCGGEDSEGEYRYEKIRKCQHGHAM